MAMQTSKTVIRVFKDHQAARDAVRSLKEAGLTDEQIGIATSNRDAVHSRASDSSNEEAVDNSYAGEGALSGVAAGAGVGALWGLGILAGVLPGIGPAIAGGTLAILLSSAAAGAAAAGLTGALIGMGVSKEEADFFASEMQSGNLILTIDAGPRTNEAIRILDRFGGYDMSNRDAASTTGTRQDSLQSQNSDSRGTSDGSRATKLNDSDTIRAHEEKIHVKKTPVQTGEVEIRKEVHTKHKTIDVPVSREEIVIERHPAEIKTGSAADFQEGRKEIRIPISEEEVQIEKEVVVKEEVSVGKRTVHDTKRVETDAPARGDQN